MPPGTARIVWLRHSTPHIDVACSNERLEVVLITARSFD
jgi:hypothetical protein